MISGLDSGGETDIAWANEQSPALEGKRSVAEGYESAPAVRDLAARLGVEMPIAEVTAALLAGETTVDGAIEALLSRPLKAERV